MRIVPGYDMYMIDLMGNIYSSCQNGIKKMRARINKSGYLHLGLRKNNKQIDKTIHRLLAITYLGLQEKSSLVVNHLDGNKLNNWIGNLEVTTASQNVLHAHKTGLIQKLFGEDHPRHKLTFIQVREIRRLLPEQTQKEIAKLFNVSMSMISVIKRNLAWQGYIK